jgi:hypothetical protein
MQRRGLGRAQARGDVVAGPLDLSEAEVGLAPDLSEQGLQTRSGDPALGQKTRRSSAGAHEPEQDVRRARHPPGEVRQALPLGEGGAVVGAGRHGAAGLYEHMR